MKLLSLKLNMFQSFYDSFFIGGRWKLYLKGAGNTLLMSAMACIIGILIALVVAVIKVYHQRTGKLKIANSIANIYTTIIRGTPALIQLLIIWYFVFKYAPTEYAVAVASLAFGLNSGAYVSEVIRAGIQSIDKGQTEAGISLGLNEKQTMQLIILPQAVKNILPALFNEFITLVKETSVASYIGINELTKAGDTIRYRTLNISSLFISAIIYLVMVILLTSLQQKLERRLGQGDNR